MIIPEHQLSADALNGLIEAYIHRDGTDYGEFELSLDRKVAELKAQVASGDVLIVYDDASESVNLMTKTDYQDYRAGK